MAPQEGQSAFRELPVAWMGRLPSTSVQTESVQPERANGTDNRAIGEQLSRKRERPRFNSDCSQSTSSTKSAGEPVWWTFFHFRTIPKGKHDHAVACAASCPSVSQPLTLPPQGRLRLTPPNPPRAQEATTHLYITWYVFCATIFNVSHSSIVRSETPA